MAPKRKAAELAEPFYDDEGIVLCQPNKDFLVKIGVNVGAKHVVRARVGESSEEAVRRWLGANTELAEQMRKKARNQGEDPGEHTLPADDIAGAFAGDVESFVAEVEDFMEEQRYPDRERRAPDRYEVKSKLRQQARGERRPEGKQGKCRRPDCLRRAAENEWLQSSLDTAKELWDKLLDLAKQAADGDAAQEEALAALQHGMLELLDEEEDSDAETGEIAEQTSNLDVMAEQTSNFSAQHRLRAKERGEVGELAIVEDTRELVWVPTTVEGNSTRERRRGYSLSSLITASAKVVQLTPFQRVTRLLVTSNDQANSQLVFDSNEDLEVGTAFAAELVSRIAAAAQAPAASASSGPATAAVSQRVERGRALREQLLEVMRLRNRHKAKEADSLLAEMKAASSEEAERAQSSGLTRKRAAELRDEAFSYGSLQITRDIVSHFLRMPELEELMEKRQGGKNSTPEVNEMIVKAAKDFLSTVFKANGRKAGTGGRLNDEARNARLAALATLLPCELFTSRRGRAACRALGLTYRQAKQGTMVRGELMDSCSGWKRVKTTEHYDKVDYRSFLDEAWHSDLLSTPDNQNKQRVRVDLGVDEKTGEHLYDLHERRAQLASTRQLLAIFRKSEAAGRLREATKTQKRPRGVEVGIRQFTDARCPCIKKRKPSQCDCEQCTFIEENLRKFHKARSGWHAAFKYMHGHRCNCPIHGAFLKYDLACEDAERAWHDAGAAAAEDVTQLSLAAEKAIALVANMQKAVQRAQTYDSMFESTKQLMAAWLPCGRNQFPEYTVTGASVYSAYRKDCAASNCPKKLWCTSESCHFQSQFQGGCPLDKDAARKYEWRVWELRARGLNKETGKTSYSSEFVPRFGTCLQFWNELLSAIPKWIYHVWRNDFIKQGLRVYEDRTSGRHLAHAQQLAKEAEGTPQEAARSEELRRARDMYQVLQRTLTVQSDYASQLEVVRSHTVTCGRPEKHNLLVSILGYRSYEQDRTFSRQKDRKQKEPSRRVSSTDVFVQRRRLSCAPKPSGNRLAQFQLTRVVPQAPRSLAATAEDVLPSSTQTVYKQHCDYLFAFHDNSYKPNARSYNVVQEDIDHFLKYGVVLHGEWFINGGRVPLAEGSHSESFPPAELTERERLPPDFPEMNRRHSVHDGCTSQFACGTEFHQTAEWRTKTRDWNGGQDDGIIREDVKLVEHHGKGPYDAAGNIPNNGVRASVSQGLAIQPGSRQLVLHLAQHYPRPVVPKEKKGGWLSADRYIYCYYHPSKFTNFSAPGSHGFHGSHAHHHFVGLCTDKAKAEKEGPLHARRMFCACYFCIMLKFDQCIMASQVGRMNVQRCPLAANSRVRRPEMRSLEEFADDLCPGMVVAMRVAADERWLEHNRPYWLALVVGPVFTAPTDMLHAGEEIREGWMVVEIQFYELQDEQERTYKLNPNKRLLNINTLVRMKGIKFDEAGVSGPRVALRSGRGHGQMVRLGEEMHYCIMAGVGEE